MFETKCFHFSPYCVINVVRFIISFYSSKPTAPNPVHRLSSLLPQTFFFATAFRHRASLPSIAPPSGASIPKTLLFHSPSTAVSSFPSFLSFPPHLLYSLPPPPLLYPSTTLADLSFPFLFPPFSFRLLSSTLSFDPSFTNSPPPPRQLVDHRPPSLAIVYPSFQPACLPESFSSSIAARLVYPYATRHITSLSSPRFETRRLSTTSFPFLTSLVFLCFSCPKLVFLSNNPHFPKTPSADKKKPTPYSTLFYSFFPALYLPTISIPIPSSPPPPHPPATSPQPHLYSTLSQKFPFSIPFVLPACLHAYRQTPFPRLGQ